MRNSDEIREMHLGEENIPPLNDSGGLYKVAAVLRALDEKACRDYCEGNKLLYIAVEEVDLTTPERVLSALGTLMEAGIWLGYLFNRSDVWSIYILSIAEERFKTPLALVLQIGSPDDLIVYLRACYKFGYQAISDQEYDALERFYLQTYPALSYLNERVNEDGRYSDVVQTAIRMTMPKSAKGDSPKSVPVDGTYGALNFEKSTSIMPVRSYKEAYDFVKKAPVCPTHWSLKMDGFNVKVLMKVDGSGLEVALSRGRATDSWDYTEAMQRIIKTHGVDVSKLKGKITGESLVDVEALDYLRTKYPGKDYKSPKSTAGAMLRAPQQFEEGDYKYLRFIPFEYGEHMKDESFRLLREAGMTPPPEIVVPAGEVPLGSLDEFSTWLDVTILDPLWEAGGARQGESDGVVLQLLTTIEGDRADKYSDLNIALKFSHWTESQYVSTVKRIIFEQQRVVMSVVLEVEPVTTRDLNVATRVNVGSAAILVKDGVKVGDTISFTRKSEAINVYEGKCC